MEIKQAEFVSSVTDVKQLKGKPLPEFAFIGRSNVGKSSLINMLTNRKTLAKVSGTPGKTQTINHFIINGAWYLVDLPGYGFASVSKDTHQTFGKIIDNYIRESEKLFFVFVLIDIRLEPQKIDLSFLEWGGTNEIPLGIIFTKADKLSAAKVNRHVDRYSQELLKRWDELPPIFVTSSTQKKGRDEVLSFIEKALPRVTKK
ncbi:MAG TPA: ribosome biogenesis GTP-binding protein YihA/YsxC [Cyclobacteriaceae bacterium]|nr:ribosome biogenesis GTP-binding protein YihA/YsxC [Cyclobacteriaceae bacterium]HMV09042.1 ribosome biogenesis GTP-binding protein YihA/YsxC [Cyclobacteriaceae bacterium]HMV89886.1 ribosome biogenesis GTP-binding protein YihA/YsxC [Cyclobacteriaceae bacterium]HMW99553.1 ribosome biogenesis GTP-binding protein YihA/YsxC [Cyclobacteriaceae bacterium]HMX51664.1 ribosome biogenesis GTP-binding protein YihA/YsxC [Cyclobacteriaceae bacterium]